MTSDKAGELVSVIIPCYNYGEFLSEAIESALAQSYKEIEIIVIDDGSADTTREAAGRYSNAGVLYYFQNNKGPSSARNHGAEIARGRYSVFFDADDILEPTFIEECLKKMNNSTGQVGYVYTQMRIFGRWQEITRFPEFSLKALLRDNYVSACSLIKTELVRRFPYDVRLRGWEDWSFYLSLAENGIIGALVDKPLLNYRKHGHANSVDDAVLNDLREQCRMRLRMIDLHPRLYTMTSKAGVIFRYFKLWSHLMITRGRGRRR